eukprot:1139524-Pelagomonas_calceolata.AAC.7
MPGAYSDTLPLKKEDCGLGILTSGGSTPGASLSMMPPDKGRLWLRDTHIWREHTWSKLRHDAFRQRQAVAQGYSHLEGAHPEQT